MHYLGEPQSYSRVDLSQSRNYEYQNPMKHSSHQHYENPHYEQNFNRYNPEYSASRTKPVQKKDNFEFGKERIKIAQYVTEQLNKDEENKKILEKFRLQAVRYRNQKYTKHTGILPYITESMVPGANIDHSAFMDKPEEVFYRKPLPYRPQRNYINKPASIPVAYRTVQNSPEIIPNKSEIGVEANFQKQFPLQDIRKSRKKKKSRNYTIQNYEQQKAFSKIDKILHQITDKLHLNNQLLLHHQNSHPKKNSRIQTQNSTQKTPIKYNRYFTQQKQEPKRIFPTIQYDTSKLKLQKHLNPGHSQKLSIKDHLKLLKKNKKRLQDLDQYIYQC